MGFFNNFPYTNFHDLNLDWILKTVKENAQQVDQIPNIVEEELEKQISKADLESLFEQFLQQYSEYVYTPEMFGAIGDGIADDTEALNKCFAEAKNNRPVVSSYSKKYRVSSSVNIAGLQHVNMGFATIFSDPSYRGSIINYNSEGYSGTIRNITIGSAFASDCTGLKIEKSNHLEIENIFIMRCGTGIEVDTGYEVIIDKALIFCNDGTRGHNAIHTLGFDSSYCHIYAVNYSTMFNMDGGNNRVNDSHCWVTSRSGYGGNAVFARINSDYNIFSRCTADTFDTGFLMVGRRPLFINDLLVYQDTNGGGTIFNGNFYDTVVCGIYGYGRNNNKIGEFTGRISGMYLNGWTDSASTFYRKHTIQFNENYTVRESSFASDGNLCTLMFNVSNVPAGDNVIGKVPAGCEPGYIVPLTVSDGEDYFGNGGFVLGYIGTNGEIHINSTGTQKSHFSGATYFRSPT